jgi:hypothetical protein
MDRFWLLSVPVWTDFVYYLCLYGQILVIICACMDRFWLLSVPVWTDFGYYLCLYGQGSVADSCEHDNKLSGCIKCGEHLD